MEVRLDIDMKNKKVNFSEKKEKINGNVKYSVYSPCRFKCQLKKIYNTLPF